MNKIIKKWLVYPDTIPWISINNSAEKQSYKACYIEKYFIMDKENEAKCYTRINKGEEGSFYYLPDKDVSVKEEEWSKAFDETDAYKLKKARYSFNINGLKYNIENFENPNDISVVEVEFETPEQAETFQPEDWFGKEITEDLSYDDVNLAQNPKKFFTQIVLTGGPCGGKSTALAILKRIFEEQGYKVLASSEVATDVIGSGASPAQLSSYNFQRVMVQRMLSLEETMRSMAYEYFQKGDGKPIIIFYDRGILDNSAYCDSKTWEKILTELGLTTEKLNHRYDGVIDVVTTARGAEEVYEQQKGNNSARYETLEQARTSEDKIQQAYAGCYNFISILNTKEGWQEKVNNIINAAREILGLDPVISQSKRMTVDIPENLEEFIKKYECVVQQIEQAYLPSENPNKEHRIRKIGMPGSWAYYETEKTFNDDGKSSTIQRVIDKETYKRLSKITIGDSIGKKRLSFAVDGLQYTLDILEGEYPELQGRAILALKGIEKNVDLPEEVLPEELRKNVQDITNNPRLESKLALGCMPKTLDDSER